MIRPIKWVKLKLGRLFWERRVKKKKKEENETRQFNKGTGGWIFNIGTVCGLDHTVRFAAHYSALKCLKGYFLYIRQIINRMATTGSGNMGWEYRFVNLTKRQASDILYKIQKYFMINKRLRHFKADFLNQNSQLRLIMTLQVRSLSLLARGFTQKYQSIYVRSCMNLIFSNKLAY